MCWVAISEEKVQARANSFHPEIANAVLSLLPFLDPNSFHCTLQWKLLVKTPQGFFLGVGEFIGSDSLLPLFCSDHFILETSWDAGRRLGNGTPGFMVAWEDGGWQWTFLLLTTWGPWAAGRQSVRLANVDKAQGYRNTGSHRYGVYRVHFPTLSQSV